MEVLEIERVQRSLLRRAIRRLRSTPRRGCCGKHERTSSTEIRAMVDSGAYLGGGYRSPAAWLVDATRESYGLCTLTLSMATRIIEMPLIRAAFHAGDLAETGLRLLTEAWAPSITDEFARDEAMLLGWATSLPAKDLALLLDTWRMQVDPDREERTAQERFDQRSVHLSKLLDGVGRLDGTMDTEGYRLLHEAIRALSRPTDDETRTAAQRRHDALVQMAKITLQSFTPEPGQKRSKPTVIGTAAITDLTEQTGGGSIDTGGGRTIVPIETIRRLACDCDMHRYLADPAGHIIDYGRKRRLISDVQFDLLLVRRPRMPVARLQRPRSGLRRTPRHTLARWWRDRARQPHVAVLVSPPSPARAALEYRAPRGRPLHTRDARRTATRHAPAIDRRRLAAAGGAQFTSVRIDLTGRTPPPVSPTRAWLPLWPLGSSPCCGARLGSAHRAATSCRPREHRLATARRGRGDLPGEALRPRVGAQPTAFVVAFRGRPQLRRNDRTGTRLQESVTIDTCPT